MRFKTGLAYPDLGSLQRLKKFRLKLFELLSLALLSTLFVLLASIFKPRKGQQTHSSANFLPWPSPVFQFWFFCFFFHGVRLSGSRSLYCPPSVFHSPGPPAEEDMWVSFSVILLALNLLLKILQLSPGTSHQILYFCILQRFPADMWLLSCSLSINHRCHAPVLPGSQAR